MIWNLWRDFCSHYQLIEAAGAVVVNSKSEVLWILRNGKWDLPKGKVEKEEKVEDAAVREVEEECAVRGINRGALLGVTYHTYLYKGEAIKKKPIGMQCLVFRRTSLNSIRRRYYRSSLGK